MRTRVLCAAVMVAAMASSVCAQAPTAREGPVRVLVLTGEGTHNWRESAWWLRQALGGPECFTCNIDPHPERLTAQTLSGYDCIVIDSCGGLTSSAEAAVTASVERGGGLVVLHAGIAAFPGWEDYPRLMGAQAAAGVGEGLVRSFPVHVTDAVHPVMRDVTDFQQSTDAPYHGLRLAADVHALATAFSDTADGGSGRDEPVCWTVERGRGRAFVLALGHDTRGFGIAYRLLVRRGVEWAARGQVSTPVPHVWPSAGMPEAQMQGFIATWYITGSWPSPNKAGFDRTFPPEDGVDLADTYAVKIGDQSAEIKWKWVEGLPGDGRLDFDIAFGHYENIAVYAYAEVTVDEAKDVLLKIGSDDGVVVFLNDRKIHANNASRGVIVDQDVIETRLEAGVNRLLFKVLQGGGQWGLVARLTDRQHNPIMFSLRTETKPEGAR